MFRKLPPVETIPTFAEDHTLHGSSAQVAADQGRDDVGGLKAQERQNHERRAAREHVKAQAQIKVQAANPLAADAVDPMTCGRCGLIQGRERMHMTAAVCISALRDRLAIYENR